jgi:hypothetical protein
MENDMEYKIIQVFGSVSDLEKQIREAMDEDWYMKGGVTVYGNSFLQAMVRYKG